MSKTQLLSLLTLAFFFSNTKAQEISIFSGFWAPEYYQDDERITKKEAKKLLLEYDESAVYWKKKATNDALFGVTYTLSLGSAVWLGAELARENETDDNGDITAPAIATLGGLIISSIFLYGSSKNAKKAVLNYNKQFDKKTTSFHLEPVLDTDGFGFALKF